MRSAWILLHDRKAGVLTRQEDGSCRFSYLADYDGPPVSVTMPVSREDREFPGFPPFFEGLLPEGVNRESLLKACGLEADDLFGQLLATGDDSVGAITVREITESKSDESARADSTETGNAP